MNERDSATRAEVVGSLLRSKEVLHAVESNEAAGGGQYDELLDTAVLADIAIQELAGMDVISDGEARRYNWAETPAYLDCFDEMANPGVLRWHASDHTPATTGGSQRPPSSMVVMRRVSQANRTGDRTAQYGFLKAHASGRTKYCMAAPSYHRRYWSDQHSTVVYANCEEYLEEIRDYMREIVAELVALGCDYIQLDAPNYGSMCDQETRARMIEQGHDLDFELDFDARLDSSVFDGVSGVTRALHICRGNAPGGRWHSSGGYGAISADLFPKLDFDRLLLEYDTDRAGTFGPLADMRSGSVAVLGLLTTKSPVLEDEQLVRDRLAEAAAVKPVEELAISTQCGFASAGEGNPLTLDEQQAKLDLVVKVARETWPARVSA
jgi:5-methyltetrahydropteroyltriglutamate--homocysteine methyltransferase